MSKFITHGTIANPQVLFSKAKLVTQDELAELKKLDKTWRAVYVEMQSYQREKAKQKIRDARAEVAAGKPGAAARLEALGSIDELIHRHRSLKRACTTRLKNLSRESGPTLERIIRRAVEELESTIQKREKFEQA